jgi:ABC-type branched-subunit amino acid transport system substrate-binding protein
MPTRKQVIEAVGKTSSFKGTTGTYGFNAAGDALQPTVSVYRAQGSAWVFASQSAVSRRA